MHVLIFTSSVRILEVTGPFTSDESFRVRYRTTSTIEIWDPGAQKTTDPNI